MTQCEIGGQRRYLVKENELKTINANNSMKNLFSAYRHIVLIDLYGGA